MMPVTLISPPQTTVSVYGKFEIKFAVATTSAYPFLQYDPAPPPGVLPGIGVTVEGIFTNTATRKVYTQPAFYMTDCLRSLTLKNVLFTEGVKKYWAIRFSPQEEGEYTVAIHVLDARQDYTSPALATFKTLPARSKGFIRVSKSDPRYFEFSNGDIYVPVGPALTNRFARTDYKSLAGTGQNWDRPWLAGLGMYSTNWARWQSSAQKAGNEGWASVLDAGVHTPESDLSFPIRLMFPPPAYPQPFKMTLTDGDPRFAPQFRKGKTYKVFMRLKVAEMGSAKNSALPYGFVVRQPGGNGWRPTEALEKFETVARKAPVIVSHIKENRDWYEVNTTFTCTKNGTTLWAYLDNITAGRVNIDEFSVKEILPDGALGGEIIRNPKADEHTYIEQRPAAYLDWAIEQAEQNGVYFQFVVHDKNDWISNRLTPEGRFGALAPNNVNYYQPENTKARWLLRNWYRYLAARWGYSTAVFAWELNNEGPPESEAHWATTEAFAKYMHEIDAHPHLASTSFWCCWMPEFWGDREKYPSVDYADIHEYTSNPMGGHEPTSHDISAWNFSLADMVAADNVGMPVIRAETGITDEPNHSLLKTPNPGVWYHAMLWAQLGAPMFDPGYFTTAHFLVQKGKTKGNPVIPKNEISRVFSQFVQMLDYNKGGYEPLNAATSNPSVRVLGQKNLATNKAFAWIQNSEHNWKSVMDNVRSVQSSEITITLNPNTPYRIEWFDTCSEREATASLKVLKVEDIESDGAGNVFFAVTDLPDDVAVRITLP